MFVIVICQPDQISTFTSFDDTSVLWFEQQQQTMKQRIE
jgi:hypothetical protein